VRRVFGVSHASKAGVPGGNGGTTVAAELSSASSGLRAPMPPAFSTSVQIIVVLTWAWPSSSWTVSTTGSRCGRRGRSI
jgi:hypothetical protein